MIRDRHVDAQTLDLLLAVEADDAGQATARTAIGDAVQIDEADALLRPVDIGDAGAQASGHESKMRIGIARLDGTLLRRQIFASMELVVLVARPLGKHGAEDFNVRGNGVFLARQPRRQTLFEIASRRVERVIEVVGVAVEEAAVRRPQLLANVDDVEPRTGRQFERDLDRGNCHQVPR